MTPRRPAAPSLLAGLALLATTAGTLAAPAPSKASGPSLVYFGTYTGEKSKGIYVASFDSATGKVGAPRLAAETESPSFLALHPTRPLLYAVNEVNTFDAEKAGSVSAFAIDPSSG